MAMILTLLQNSQGNSRPVVEISPATPFQYSHTDVSSLTSTNKTSVEKRKEITETIQDSNKMHTREV